MTKFITQNDIQSSNSFMTHHLGRFIGELPSALYHYTRGGNLIPIISDNELWATHISCLNDTKEMAYSVDELQKRVREKLATNQSDELLPLLRGLNAAMDDPGIETATHFVSCFSERADDLSQWRAYGGGEGGYSIAFNPEVLKQSAQGSAMLLKVDYDARNHAMFFDDVIKWVEHFFLNWEGRKSAPNVDEWVDEFISFFFQNLSFLVIGIKHPAFEAEKEWRLVYPFSRQDVLRIKIRQGPSMLSRHIPLPLAKPLPITGVCVGPARYPENNRVAVGDLLLLGGHDLAKVKIDNSKVPFRG